MQLSSHHGFAFLCAPKCASSSIESAIAPYCNVNFSGPGRIKHINAQDYRETILRYHRQKLGMQPIEAFSIFRDPLEWLFSWYRYRQRNDIKHPGSPMHHWYTGNMSFEHFVDAYCNSTPRPKFANVGNQARFHSLRDGRIGVEKIFAMTRLDKVESYLSDRLNTEIKLPHKNAAPGTPVPSSDSRLLSLKGMLPKVRVGGLLKVMSGRAHAEVELSQMATGSAPSMQLSAAAEAMVRGHLSRDYAIWRRIQDADGVLVTEVKGGIAVDRRETTLGT